MNALDVIALLLLIVTFVAGIRSGFFPQLGGLLGAAAGGIVALQLLPLIRPQLTGLDPSMRALVVLVGLVVLIAIGETIGSAIGYEIRGRLGGGVLAGMDSAGGGFLGLGQGMLVVWLVGGLLAAGPLPNLAAQAQRSAAVRALSGILPSPTAIAGELGRWLDASGLPEVFVGLEPIPAPPVDLPKDPAVRAIAERAIPSTVEVDSQACSYTLAGSGFVVADEYVLTNAHVIAGARAITVLPQSGSRTATAVYFNPELDVALLHVDGLKAPALQLASRNPSRGAVGAALGHPGGGPLVVVPAAVADSYDANGRDLDGDQNVTRSIVELRATIERGDSGGPFVLADGTVGGVIFAQSKTDATVGYALAPLAVRDAIAGALGATAPVDTGDCIR
jgi:S1-C subfamily serine protease